MTFCKTQNRPSYRESEKGCENGENTDFHGKFVCKMGRRDWIFEGIWIVFGRMKTRVFILPGGSPPPERRSFVELELTLTLLLRYDRGHLFSSISPTCS